MVVVMVYRPEITDGGFDPDCPFEGFEIVGIRANNFLAEALLDETIARAKAIGQNVDNWFWLTTPIPESGMPPKPEFSWHGWDTGEDVEPKEPGKEWLTITEDGEEYATIVLRVDRADDVEAARAAREIRANAIARALNDMVERGDYP